MPARGVGHRFGRCRAATRPRAIHARNPSRATPAELRVRSAHWLLAACRTWGVESENRPRRGQFLPDSQAHSPAMGQEGGEKWTAAVDLQPALPKSDRLLGQKTIRLARRGRLVPVATRAANYRRPGGHRHTQWACRGGVSAACQASSAPNQRLPQTDMAGLLQQWR